MSSVPVAVGALVMGIGLADSLNPSTVVPAVALAVDEDGPRRVAGFTVGVGLVSLIAGVALVTGPGQALMAAIPHPRARVKHLGEIGLGLVLLVLAVGSWLGRRRLAEKLSQSGSQRSRGAGLAAAFALGAGIMAVELPTALPYFGAIAAIIGTGASLSAQVLLVVAYNLAFVLPLLVIVAVRLVAGERAAQPLERFRTRAAQLAGAGLTALLGVGGTALIAVGLSAM